MEQKIEIDKGTAYILNETGIVELELDTEINAQYINVDIQKDIVDNGFHYVATNIQSTFNVGLPISDGDKNYKHIFDLLKQDYINGSRPTIKYESEEFEITMKVISNFSYSICYTQTADMNVTCRVNDIIIKRKEKEGGTQMNKETIFNEENPCFNRSFSFPYPELYYMIYVQFSNNDSDKEFSSKTYMYEVSKSFYDCANIGDKYYIRKVINRNPKQNAWAAASGDLSALDYNDYASSIIEYSYRGPLIQIIGKDTYSFSSVPISSWRYLYEVRLYSYWQAGEREEYTENWEDITIYDSVKQTFKTIYSCKKNKLYLTSLEDVHEYCKHPEKLDKIKTISLEQIDKPVKPVKLYMEPDKAGAIYIDTEDGSLFINDTTISSYTFDTGITPLKEEKTMANSIFNNIFDNVTFGKVTTKQVKYSINGIAFMDKNGKYFTYSDGKATDVTGMIIDVPLFALPVAVNQIKVGDTIFFKEDYVIVKEIVPDGLKVINPVGGNITTIIPETNIFNFNYYTKIINPFESMSNTANQDNPFGNLLPFMFFSDINKSEDGDMMKYLMLTQMTGNNIDFTSNPMMFYFLMNGDSSNIFFPIIALMGGLQNLMPIPPSVKPTSSAEPKQ